MNQGRLKATIVVPVYNPGPSIDRCIASVLAQSMPADAWEAVFVDDGSTDDTPAVLDALAAAHSNITVIHTPNSGWAGRPRNIGIEHARGEYVQLLDQDDELAPEALERMTAMADRNASDIVLGKVASDFRGVAPSVFRVTRERCTLRDGPLISSLTPHKLFRTAFLREHELRFAEGRRRLEDQLFMVQAYFRATVVSILADAVCYRYLRREDRGNAGSELPEPDGYYANLREVTDVVLANTDPGEFRDRLLARFVRTEILGRLSGARFARLDASYRATLFAAARVLAVDIVTPGVMNQLAALDQVRLGLLLDGDLPDLVTIGERTGEVQGTAELIGAKADGPRLILDLRCRLLRADGVPLTVVRRGGRWFGEPWLVGGLEDRSPDVTQAVQAPGGVVSLRDPRRSEEWIVRGVARVERPPGVGSRDTALADGVALPIVLRVEVMVRPDRAAAGMPLPPGIWEVHAHTRFAGLDRIVPVDGSQVSPADLEVRVWVTGRHPAVMQLVRTEDGQARIDVAPVTSLALRDRVTLQGRRIVRLPAYAGRGLVRRGRRLIRRITRDR
jgi:glycosyltransferase involved in cell wall biosynthesis